MSLKSNPVKKHRPVTFAPEELISFRVSVLSQMLSRVVHADVSSHLNLSSRQWRVLVMLHRLGPATSGEVARATHLDQSQVSRASYELVGKGLLRMNADPDDRRRQCLSLTREGVHLINTGVVRSKARQQQLRACLSEMEYKALGTVLEKLMRQAQTMLEQGSGKAA